MSDVDSKESVHVWEQVVYDNLCTHLSILVLPEISLKKKKLEILFLIFMTKYKWLVSE